LETLTRSQADELLRSLLLLGQSVHRVLERRVVEVSGNGLSQSKVSLLRILSRKGPQSPTAMAEFLNVSRPAVSQIASEMIEQGLILKSKSTKDSRRLHLAITEGGLEVVAGIEEAQRHLIRLASEYASGDIGSQWIESVHQLTDAIVHADDRFEQHCYQCEAYSNDSCVLVDGGAHCSYRVSVSNNT
jgi:DNA-binding MarR family transcriptional regulator